MVENEIIPSIEDLTHEILPEDYPTFDLAFKMIVIGDSSVGKSCLTTKGTKNIFDDDYNATVGFEFATSSIKVGDKVCKLQIWDTCGGQEDNKSLLTNYSRNSSLAILVYSINNKESYQNLNFWFKEFKNYSSPNALLFLIGNKCDLENDRKVSYQDGLKFKEENNIDFFMETSAKTGLNAQKVFVEATKLLYVDNLKYINTKIRKLVQ